MILFVSFLRKINAFFNYFVSLYFTFSKRSIKNIKDYLIKSNTEVASDVVACRLTLKKSRRKHRCFQHLVKRKHFPLRNIFRPFWKLSKPGAEQAFMKSMQTYQTSFLKRKLKNCKTFLFVKKRICKNETFAVYARKVCVTLCKPK